MSTQNSDEALREAIELVQATRRGELPQPEVKSFFDETTSTVTHIVKDPGSSSCAIIDSVLDFDIASARTLETSAARLMSHIHARGLKAQWLLETHVHADHLSAGSLLQERLGGRLAIGRHIAAVQEVFGKIFNIGTEFASNSGFDHLFSDGDRFKIGHLNGIALHVPGHTPACMAYVIGDTVFPGDTLFMPDYGTARCDFPGGDAEILYQSIQRLFALPDETRVFLCHDYKAPGRDTYMWETTIASERSANIHVHEGVSKQQFVAMRKARDAELAVPELILPSVQVNIRGGRLPEPEANGIRYLKLPLNGL